MLNLRADKAEQYIYITAYPQKGKSVPWNVCNNYRNLRDTSYLYTNIVMQKDISVGKKVYPKYGCKKHYNGFRLTISLNELFSKVLD